jgi:hypothetical protein
LSTFESVVPLRLFCLLGWPADFALDTSVLI